RVRARRAGTLRCAACPHGPEPSWLPSSWNVSSGLLQSSPDRSPTRTSHEYCERTPTPSGGIPVDFTFLDGAVAPSDAPRRPRPRPPASDADLDPLIGRIGNARYVLLGEATHGTSEFYTWRARLSRRLVREKGFSFVAVEGDWPDCARIDQYVKRRAGAGR